MHSYNIIFIRDIFFSVYVIREVLVFYKHIHFFLIPGFLGVKNFLIYPCESSSGDSNNGIHHSVINKGECWYCI